MLINNAGLALGVASVDHNDLEVSAARQAWLVGSSSR